MYYIYTGIKKCDDNYIGTKLKIKKRFTKCDDNYIGSFIIKNKKITFSELWFSRELREKNEKYIKITDSILKNRKK